MLQLNRMLRLLSSNKYGVNFFVAVSSVLGGLMENLAVKEDRHFDYKDCPSVVAR